MRNARKIEPIPFENGNLLSDGQTTYAWDAEGRLIGITYPGAPGKETAVVYDGLGRRVAIARTPADGGAAVTTSYLWCGLRPCQARDASNATTRAYYAEGEYVPGNPAQPYYYGIDQLGSVRRAFASASSAPAYGYDPYGVPLQAAASLTDFGYAGLFHEPDGGFDFAVYRVYDPATSRWLSRDSLGEGSDPAANLYRYVDANPIGGIDPQGLWQVTVAAGAGYGGAITFGYNSGQFNIGGYAGVSEGAGIVYNPNNTPATCTGLTTNVVGNLAVGLYKTVSGEAGTSIPINSPMSTYNAQKNMPLEFQGSVNLAPYATGAKIKIYGPRKTEVTPQVTFATGLVSYLAVGGTYTFGGR